MVSVPTTNAPAFRYTHGPGLGGFLLVVLALRLNPPVHPPRPAPGTGNRSRGARGLHPFWSRVYVCAGLQSQEKRLGRRAPQPRGPESGGERELTRPRLGSLRARLRRLPVAGGGPLEHLLPIPAAPLLPARSARASVPSPLPPPFGSSFPPLPAALAGAEPHTSGWESNQAVSLSCPGCKGKIIRCLEPYS